MMSGVSLAEGERDREREGWKFRNDGIASQPSVLFMLSSRKASLYLIQLQNNVEFIDKSRNHLFGIGVFSLFKENVKHVSYLLGSSAELQFAVKSYFLKLT